MNQVMMLTMGASAVKSVFRGMLVSVIRKIIRFCGGLMLKLIVMGIVASSLSSLTGIPVFPVQPVISGHSLSFVPTEIDKNRLAGFKEYVRSKFN